MRGLILGFLSNIHEGQDSECEAKEITPNNDSSRPYGSTSKIVVVGDRQAISRVDWPINRPLG